jgi:Uma2 family endonuclease
MTATLARKARPETAQDYRLSLSQYQAMIAAGILSSEDRIELIHGRLVRKMSKHPPHEHARRRFFNQLNAILPNTLFWQTESPISCQDSSPEPDIAVILGPDDRFVEVQPSASDVVLVVEVSDTSLSLDLGEKLEIYAASKIAQYWVVDIPNRAVHVFTKPRGGKKPTYRQQVTHTSDIPLSLDGQDCGSIPFAKLFVA